MPPPVLHPRLEFYRRIAIDSVLDHRNRGVFAYGFLVAIILTFVIFIAMASNVFNFHTPFADRGQWGGQLDLQRKGWACENAVAFAARNLSDPDSWPLAWQPILAVTSWFYTASGVLVLTLAISDSVVKNSRAYYRKMQISRRTHPVERLDSPEARLSSSRLAMAAAEVDPEASTAALMDEEYEVRPYALGPRGDKSSKVTAVSRKRNARGSPDHFQSTDDSYMKGSTPSLMRREPIWGALFGLAFVNLGVAGLLLHSSLTKVAYDLEWVSWHAVVFLFAVYAGARAVADGFSQQLNLCFACYPLLGLEWRVACNHRARNLTSIFATWGFIGLLVALIVICGLLPDEFERNRIYVMGAFVFLTLFFVAFHHAGRSWAVEPLYEAGVLGTVLMCGSFLFLTHEADMCVDSESLFQPHALFHFLSSLALLAFYFALRGDVWKYDVIFAEEHIVQHGYRVPGPSSPSSRALTSFSSAPPPPPQRSSLVPPGSVAVGTPIVSTSGGPGLIEAMLLEEQAGRGRSGSASSNGSGNSSRRGSLSKPGGYVERDLIPRPRPRSLERRPIPPMGAPTTVVTVSATNRARGDSGTSSTGSHRVSAERPASIPLPAGVGPNAAGRGTNEGSRRGSVHSTDSGGSSKRSSVVGGVPRDLDQPHHLVWTCTNCAYPENDAQSKECERCHAEIPSDVVYRVV